jgi:hypothetical protein
MQYSYRQGGWRFVAPRMSYPDGTSPAMFLHFATYGHEVRHIATLRPTIGFETEDAL